jgi:hypothetical protein
LLKFDDKKTDLVEVKTENGTYDVWHVRLLVSTEQIGLAAWEKPTTLSA